MAVLVPTPSVARSSIGSRYPGRHADRAAEAAETADDLGRRVGLDRRRA